MLIKYLWQVFDVLCYIAALVTFVVGFFILNTIAGIFALGVALIALGLLSEAVAQKRGDG